MSLNMVIWNANGLAQNQMELEVFLNQHDIDVMLISETHFTSRSFMKIPKYIIYATNHPDGTVHGGTAIIIKSKIKHHELEKYNEHYLQATSVSIILAHTSIVTSAVYCPPKHIITRDNFTHFFKILGRKFVAGGDFNAKHVFWGSRLTTTRGRELRKSMLDETLGHISTGEPTYWPTDRNKLPDLLDFCVTKGISSNYTNAKSSLEMSSDHSPVIVTIHSQVICQEPKPTLSNKHTNWDHFRHVFSTTIQPNIALKTPQDLDKALQHLNCTIQEAAFISTPIQPYKINKSCSMDCMQQIAEKRRLRKRWQMTRAPVDKLNLNRATRQLKILLRTNKDRYMQRFLHNLSPTQATEYSLWKATKQIHNPQHFLPPIRNNNSDWARTDFEKAQMFADHLASVFRPFPPNSSSQTEAHIHEFLQSPFQMDLPIKPFRFKDLKHTIDMEIKERKSPGFDLISGKIIKELPSSGIKLLTHIFNAILRIHYFPIQWKVAEIKMIKKPGKCENEVQSYRPISLLPILSKIFEKLFSKKLKSVLNLNNIIPDHQFGFREQHATVEQIHRVVNYIHTSFEQRKYCSAVFLDVSQAFDKVWHTGLLYKLKLKLPPQFYLIIKSYLDKRYFYVKVNDEQTNLVPITAGVPQGSVLGPLLYVLFTSDLPLNSKTETATFADDTVIMASHRNEKTASHYVQANLNEIEEWLSTWRIKVNENKSTHITFTLNRETCPPVKLNNKDIPQNENTKYLGMHLDRRLTWKKHIFTKRKQMGLIYHKMQGLMGRNSTLRMDNKLLIYNTIIKPVWTYGIQLWGTASNSNIEIIQRFQSKVLRDIADAPWYVPNNVIQRDLQTTSVSAIIQMHSIKYSNRLTSHPNILASTLFSNTFQSRRLKRLLPLDLLSRN